MLDSHVTLYITIIVRRFKMKKYWTIKEFSKLTKTTVRTLQYYDEQGILKPHHKSDVGYRFYSIKELEYFKKITILKYLGFDLKQIKTLLINNHIDWIQCLNTQLNIIQHHINYLQNKLMFINNSITSYNSYQKLDWQDMYNLLETLQVTYDNNNQDKQDNNTDSNFNNNLDNNNIIQYTLKKINNLHNLNITLSQAIVS